VALPARRRLDAANASCQGRKDTGTLLGGRRRALIGKLGSKGGGGAIVGGLGAR